MDKVYLGFGPSSLSLLHVRLCESYWPPRTDNLTTCLTDLSNTASSIIHSLCICCIYIIHIYRIYIRTIDLTISGHLNVRMDTQKQGKSATWLVLFHSPFAAETLSSSVWWIWWIFEFQLPWAPATLRQDMKCYDRGDECQKVRDRWEAVGKKAIPKKFAHVCAFLWCVQCVTCQCSCFFLSWIDKLLKNSRGKL